MQNAAEQDPRSTQETNNFMFYGFSRIRGVSHDYEVANSSSTKGKL